MSVPITIRTAGRHQSIVLGARIGQVLAIHPAWLEEEGFAITHVPTGYAVCFVFQMHDAIDIACQIDSALERHGISWTETKPRSAIKQARGIIKPILRQWDSALLT